MPLEIERRFLVINGGWRDHVAWEAELRQGYLLSREDGLTVRIRLQQQLNRDPECWLTIKALPDPGAPAHARQEFEYPIPDQDAEELLKHSASRLEKRRYGLWLSDGGDWVIDVFSGGNFPLVIAEVELQHPQQALQIPPWCGQEITGLHKFSNACLASHPWQSWCQEEQRALPSVLLSDPGSQA